MSHDWLVATRTRPAPLAIDAFAQSAGLALDISGAFRSGSNVLVTRTNGATARTIDIDGPDRAEPEDLPDDLAGVVPKAAWLVAIHLPGGYAADEDGWTLDLAIHLARSGDGAVFDPQADRVAWPTGVTPRPRGQTRERIRTLGLTWIIPASRLPGDAPARWLDLAARLFPGAVPVRFGEYEPFQGRLDRDGPGAFAEAWQATAARRARRDALLVRRSAGLRRLDELPGPPSGATPGAPRPRRPPLLHDRRPAAPSRSCRRRRRGGVLSRGRALVRGRLRDGFGRTRRHRGPRPVLVGSPLRDRPLARRPWWVGLPAIPTWLAWYGEPYRDLVEDHVAGLAEAEPDGLLVRAGDVPMDRDELDGMLPPPPADLRAVRRPGSSVDPAARYTLLAGPPSDPAEVIPWID